MRIDDINDLGNRLIYDDDGSAITYASNTVNEYSDVDGSTPEYDAAGNLTKDQNSYAYFYDAENMLTRIEDASYNAIASYKYDAFSRRIEKVDEKASETLRFYYDKDLRVLSEWDDAGTPARQRYFVWGNYIDELLMLNDDAGDDSDYFVCRDHLYSPAVLVDDTGAVTERYDYDAYGGTSIYTDDGGDSNWWDGDETYTTGNLIGNPYFFTGRRLDVLDSDDSFEIMYYRARYYSPELGRFIQRDPLGIVPNGSKHNPFKPGKQYIDGMNIYEYVNSLPLTYSDPYGQFKFPKPKPGEVAKRVIGLQLCRLAGCLAAVVGMEIMCDVYLDDEEWAQCTCEMMAESTGLRILCFGYRNKILDAFQCSTFGVDY